MGAPAASAGRTPTLRLVDCSHSFFTSRGRSQAIEDVSMVAYEGEFVSVVGPSGCGKSTILSILSGLLKPTTGSAEVLGQPVRGVNRDVGFILQRDALLPWRTALQNVALPLRFRGASKQAARATAGEWLNRVGLGRFASHYPHQLSGGMRKRVAIAATLCYEPRLLLMDEPFSALDIQTRTLMESDLLGLWQGSGQTVVFVTHDLEEAVGMSDRIVVMSATPGRVVADEAVTLDRPRDLLDVKFLPEFTRVHERIWGHLRREVLAAQRPDLGQNLEQGEASHG